MDKYYCECCKYITANSSHMNRHVKSKKHIDCLKLTNNKNKIKKIKLYECAYCGEKIINRTAKWRHEKICGSQEEDIPVKKNKKCKVVEPSSPENDKLDRLEKQYEKLLNKYETVIDTLASSNKNVTEASNKTAEVATKSMSILKYATLHMTDAPPLIELNKNEAISILGYKGLDENLTDEQKEYENDMYVQSVIAHYINKNLVNFLSVMIAAYFRKPGDNLKKMSSVWAVDVARLSFIIMSTISKDGDKEWRSDKTGKSFTASVIKPMLVALNEITRTYIKYKENVHTKTNLTIEEMNKIKILRQGCVDLSKDIRYQRLEKPLLKAVAPSFQFEEFMKKTK